MTLSSQPSWQYVREAVDTADSGGDLLGTTNSDWGQRSMARGLDIPGGAKAIILAFIGDHATEPEDGEATIKVSLYRSGGPAQVVQSFDLTVGGQACNFKPRREDANATAKWVDEIVPNASDPASYWISTPEIVGVLDDNVACIAIHTYGAAHMTVEVTALDSGLSLDVLMAPLGELP